MKNVMMLVMVLGSLSCSLQKPETKYTIPDYTDSFSVMCLNGMVYYDGGNQLTPKFNHYGRVERCKLKK